MRRKTKAYLMLFLVLLPLIALLIMGLYLSHLQTVRYRQQLQLIEETRHLLEEVKRLRQESEALEQRMEEWLDAWEVMTVEITAYAPLDPQAKAGMCYAGDPGITASGAPVQPGMTAAAGPDVPFGTRVWAAGAMRVVQDRGGSIGARSLDLCVETQEQALRVGRQRSVAVFRKER